MKKSMIILTAAAALLAAPAQAEKMARIMANPDGCSMKEQVTISVSFNQKVNGFADGEGVFRSHMKKIEDYAAEQKVKVMIQSQNYNVSSQRDYNDMDGLSYQMNGSMSYQMDDVAAATKFAEFLTQQQKMQVNLSSNAYRQGNCPNG